MARDIADKSAIMKDLSYKTIFQALDQNIVGTFAIIHCYFKEAPENSNGRNSGQNIY